MGSAHGVLLNPSLARAGRALCQPSVTSKLQLTNGSSFQVNAGFTNFEAVARALEPRVG